jgi:tRNA-Thr(GGU) m(6)t(6)A37 methyltransferase TsaA
LADGSYELQPIGWVESSLVDLETAPKQGDEGSPDAWLVFEQTVSEGLGDLQRGTEIIVLTWLDRARRDVLKVHPRDDPANPEKGVFSTRSADRPNPIGLHRVEILSINGPRIRVRNLEALDRTPIVDVKPVLNPKARRVVAGSAGRGQSVFGSRPARPACDVDRPHRANRWLLAVLRVPHRQPGDGVAQ